MKSFITCSLFLVCVAGFSQKNHAAAQLIAQADDSEKSIQKHTATTTPDLKTAKDDELLLAAKNADSETKIAIATELVERKSPKTEQLFRDFLEDNRTVIQKLGSISYETTSAAELFSAVARQKEKAERKKYYEKTNSKNVQNELKGLFGRDYSTKWTVAECDAFLPKLTAMALAKNEVHPQTLNQIFETLQYKSKNYERIKFFARKYASEELLATLARFKNPSDVTFLKEQKEKSYLAISYFPDAGFFGTLKEASPSFYTNQDYQNAVCAYKTAQSKALLDTMCDSIFSNQKDKTQRDDALFQLYGLIEKQNFKPYASVLKKIDALMAKR
ncbi:hypothetical protein [Flavobacterium silvaticum]|uniref:Uncharacterized protein n=1 Tax=Flavobacterium silvaticum TaxID=1852020 RepID=A0A972G2T5_9FLAO|nr:hypothetical protein [Flavobacterium silvaticum]NMH29451.1 hypothetical protein [Flavobacterium silvaticum]